MANNYNLSLSFTDEQLKAIQKTGSNVIIAKPTGGSAATVAWQSFKPMQLNSVGWEENYGIYVSTSEVVHGAQLFQHSSTDPNAQAETLYTIESSAVITDNSQGGQKNAYSLLNNYDNKDYMTVGLYQGATINGESIPNNAISAAPVLLKSTAVMTPYTTLYVWIQSQVVSNTVVTTIASPMTELVFGGNVNSLSVAYDTKTGTFLPVVS